MNKITYLFKSKKRNIFSIYFTAGFPKLNDTTNIIKELQNNHVDMIEIGIPFSDPIADGEIIQTSNNIALQNGMTLKFLFKELETIKNELNVPLIMMGYLNPIMQYGFENFCKDCQKIGISGIIIPDLPIEEYINEYKLIVESYHLKTILLITPNSSEKRIRLIDNHTKGFIYLVSSSSTTGIQKKFDIQKQNYFNRINKMKLKNPLLIGFGVSNQETLSTAFKYAAGAIVGSKFITLLSNEQTTQKAVQKLILEFKSF